MATLHILCVYCICYMAACNRMVCIIVMSNGAGGCRHALFYSVIRFYCFSIDAFKLHSMLESSSTNHFKFKKENNHVDYSSFHYNMWLSQRLMPDGLLSEYRVGQKPKSKN
jgi:hypothetical protein